MKRTPSAPANIAGLILAGGDSTRMHGHDKGLQKLNGQPLVAHVIARLHPQVAQIWLSANRHLAQYQNFGLPILRDEAEFQGMGPLAGVASFSRHLPADYTHVQIVPCDTPFIPTDLSERLCVQLIAHSARAAFPVTDGPQYGCALIERAMLDTAAEALRHDQRSLHRWLSQQHALALEGFKEQDFANLNTPEQLQSHHIDPTFGASHA